MLYNDGKVLKIFQTSENEARISGSKINNEFYNVGVIADENGLVTDVEYEGKVAPCNEHPGGESWEDCFKREVDEFCDGPAGCITLYSPFGIIVAVMIAVHCADC